MSLPELHGWLPAAALARREGVSPTTIRRRAAKGAFDVIPNPIGPGALYRAQGAHLHHATDSPGDARTNRENPASVDLRALTRTDRLAFGLGDVSTTDIARELGVSKGTAHRTLCRMEAAGLMARAGQLPSGPRGGRPRTIWRAATD